ncbi:unnamed protein product, partial [Brachionus calyciflorus]
EEVIQEETSKTDDRPDFSIENLKKKKSYKRVLYSETSTDEEVSIENTEKKMKKREKKKLNNRLDDLSLSFFEKTDTVVEDAAYEVEDVLDVKKVKNKLLFKIKWKDDQERRVSYEESWERSSNVSFSKSFVGEITNRLKEKTGLDINLPEKKKYFIKKVEVSDLPANTRAIADEFYEIDDFLKKNK